MLPPIIKLSEGLYVLLFAHGLSTMFDNHMPPPAPLDTDLRLIWKMPKTKYEIYSEKHSLILTMR